MAFGVAALAAKLYCEPDGRVALLLEREPSMVLAVYAVLLAGGCYVPVEPDYPPDRIRSMVQDAGCKTVVTQKRFFEHAQDALEGWFDGNVVVCDADDPDAGGDANDAGGGNACMQHRLFGGPLKAPGAVNVRPEHLVYVFYTSGTTGKPKGVMVEHRGLVRRIAWFQRLYGLCGDDAVLLKTTYTFGISEWELFWAPTVGSTTVVASAAGHRVASYINELIVKGGVTVVCFVPSALCALAEHVVAESGPRAKMRLAVSCGEALPMSTTDMFFRAFNGALLNNVYGPTEADMTFFEMDAAKASKMNAAPPIGRPMDNVTVYLLDEDLRPVPIGAPGHLHFGAPHAARGYLGLPALTQACWVANPFFPSGDPRVPAGPMLYATGDLARLLPSGDLAFCGRVGQIKLRGYRIELDEVAAALRSHASVAAAAAALVDADKSGARLVGYVVRAAAPIEGAVELLERRDLCDDALDCAKDLLPAYALPSVIVELSRLPETARGKLDRSALPVPPRGFGVSSDEFVPCATATELAIEAVWQDLLEFEGAPISSVADFVTLGGNSLLAGRATTRIRHDIGVALAGTSMYLYPNIADLA
ncbi:hypothetical protein M885DRAFT_444314, partial [Pelagophyceae sp. CCMP2097]